MGPESDTLPTELSRHVCVGSYSERSFSESQMTEADKSGKKDAKCVPSAGLLSEVGHADGRAHYGRLGVLSAPHTLTDCTLMHGVQFLCLAWYG